MKKPDFYGIGAMKAATTWAWQQLAQHPDIQMPEQKELHYFDQLNITPQQYLSRFPDTDKITGEITPAYLTIPHAPLLAAAINPEAKVFVILRNPVDRAFSHWKVALWTENKIPFGTSFRDSFDHGHPHQGAAWHSIREKGLYVKYLKRWYDSFPEMKVFWYDDVQADPFKIVKQIYELVGVDSDFVPNTVNEKCNENWSGRNPEFYPQDRQHVLNFYMPSIERLEKFTGRDLSSWKK